MDAFIGFRSTVYLGHSYCNQKKNEAIIHIIDAAHHVLHYMPTQTPQAPPIIAKKGENIVVVIFPEIKGISSTSVLALIPVCVCSGLPVPGVV
jgi:hypothetical protein